MKELWVIQNNGKFSLTIDSKLLVRGLRPSKETPRNEGFLVEASGVVGRGGVLQVLDNLTRMDTSIVTDSFPYPQVFVFTDLIIVCGKTTIYEWIEGELVEKLNVMPGDTWSVIDFYDYVYMSNNAVAVLRNTLSKTYVVTTDLPVAKAICNFNGQVLVVGINRFLQCFTSKPYPVEVFEASEAFASPLLGIRYTNQVYPFDEATEAGNNLISGTLRALLQAYSYAEAMEAENNLIDGLLRAGLIPYTNYSADAAENAEAMDASNELISSTIRVGLIIYSNYLPEATEASNTLIGGSLA